MELPLKKLKEAGSDVLREMLGYLIEQLIDVDVICEPGTERGLPTA